MQKKLSFCNLAISRFYWLLPLKDINWRINWAKNMVIYNQMIKCDQKGQKICAS